VLREATLRKVLFVQGKDKKKILIWEATLFLQQAVKKRGKIRDRDGLTSKSKNPTGKEGN